MSDFLEQMKDEIRARMAELKGSVDEYTQLQAALTAMDNAGGLITAPRRGRPRGSGSRAQEVLAQLTAEPGLTAHQIADRLGIQVNYLYRVLPALAEDGKLVKKGRGWYLAGA